MTAGPRSGSKGLWLVATIAVVSGLLVASNAPAFGADGERPIAAPTLAAPEGKCAIRSGNDTLTFGGSATAGSQVTKVEFRYLDGEGALVGTRDITSLAPISIAPNGSITGSAQAGRPGTKDYATVSAVVIVSLNGMASEPGQSNAIALDEVRPTFSGAHTAGDRLVVAEFSEPVFSAKGDLPADWLIDGDTALMVSGAGGTRTLTSVRTLGEDATPLVRYKPLPTRGDYKDCAGNDFATGNQIPQHVALDRIPPKLPSLDSLDGKPAATTVWSKNPTPRAAATGLTPGHTAELYLETSPGSGFSSEDDTLLGEVVADSAGRADFPSIPSLTVDGSYTFYAAAVDVHGNRSVDSAGHEAADSATYLLDRVAPRHTVANTSGDSVTVSFNETIVGADDVSEWSISGCTGGCTISSVTGSGSVRVLEMAAGSLVPNGATVAWTDAGGTPYTDRAGNVLPDFSSLTTQGLIPKIVDLVPETGAESVNRTYTLELSVTDEFGTPIPGALAGVRATAGPASKRDFDGDGGNPQGVITSCLSGSDGTCTVSYKGKSAGTDTIQAWLLDGGLGSAPAPEPADADTADPQPNPSDQDGQDVVKIDWLLEGADVALDAAPETSSGPINQPHVVSVVVSELGSTIEQRAPANIGGVNVDLRATSGPNTGWLGDCTTRGDGTCDISYDSAVTGTDNLQVWIDRNGDDTPDDDLFLDSAEGRSDDGNPVLDDPAQDVLTRTWAGIQIPQLDLSPETSLTPVGKDKVLTARVTGTSGGAIAAANVDAYVVSGPNQGLVIGECQTDANGNCTLRYESRVVGDDIVRAWIDLDDDDTPDELSASESLDEQTGENDPNQDLVVSSWGIAGAVVILDASPETTTRAYGKNVTFGSTLVDTSARAIGNAPLAARVLSGPGATADLDDDPSTALGTVGSCSTSRAGACSFTYSGSVEGVDQILVWVDDDGNGISNEVAAPENSEQDNRHDVIEVSWVEDDGGELPIGTREVKLGDASKKVRFGKPAFVAGTVVADDGCAPTQVTVQRSFRRGGFTDAALLDLDDRGAWRYEFKARRNVKIRAAVAADEMCSGDLSGTTEILVRAKVKARATDSRVERGSCVKIKGALKPRKKGRPVALQIRRRGGAWKTMKRDVTNRRSRFSFPLCLDRAGKTVLRVRFGGDKVNAAARSRVIRIRVR